MNFEKVGVAVVAAFMFAILMVLFSPLIVNVAYATTHGLYGSAALWLGTFGFISGFLAAITDKK